MVPSVADLTENTGSSTENTGSLPENIGSWQPAALAVFRPVFRLLWRIEVNGIENIPEDGPAVMCPNHLAAIDSFFLPVVLPRGIQYVGKAEYLDDWKTSKLFPALGMIPIDRRGGDHATAALDAARQVLNRGGLFGIYPEGTRSRSGKLHKGHTGAARLAIETGSPIIPVGLVGTLDVQPPDKSMPNFFRPVTINIGKPVDVTRYRDRVGDRAVYREVIDEVMYEIQALCGQEYEHTYAGAKKVVITAEVTESGTEIDVRESVTPEGAILAGRQLTPTARSSRSGTTSLQGAPLGSTSTDRPATKRVSDIASGEADERVAAADSMSDSGEKTRERRSSDTEITMVRRKSSSDVLQSRPLADVGH